MRYLALVSLLALFACTGTIDDNTSGGNDISEPSTANLLIFEDMEGSPVTVSEILIMSDVLPDKELHIKLETPTSRVDITSVLEVDKIAAYEFYVVSQTGMPYYGQGQFYAPPYGGLRKTITLHEGLAWKTKQIRSGLKWYNYEGYEPLSGEQQVINILEMNLDNDALKLEFQYYPERQKISQVANGDSKILAVVNASFGSGFTSGDPVDNTYIRVNGVNYKEISIGPEDTGNGWKHEAAVWYDGDKQLGVISKPNDPAGAIELYKSTTYPNLFSSNVLLIEDGKRSDMDAYSKNFGKSSSKDPRTLLAVTQDRKLLLMTVDGRWLDKAAGMSYTQLQNFLMTFFNPKFAINMDGGGSTSMFVKGNKVVNYPCEGVSGDTYKPYPGTFKERGLVTYFAIKEK